MALRDAGSGGFEYEGRAIVEIAAPLEDAEPGQFGPRMKWQLWVWENPSGDGETQGELLTAEDTWWQFTSEAMGKKAKARAYIEAFYDRELESGESGTDLAAGLYDEATQRGLRAGAKIEINENGYTQIDYLYPIGKPPKASAAKAAGKAPAAAATTRKAPGGAPAAAAAPATRRAPGAVAAPAAPESAGGDIDPDDLPF